MHTNKNMLKMTKTSAIEKNKNFETIFGCAESFKPFTKNKNNIFFFRISKFGYTMKVGPIMAKSGLDGRSRRLLYKNNIFGYLKNGNSKIFRVPNTNNLVIEIRHLTKSGLD